jgi:hypothetical protein
MCTCASNYSANLHKLRCRACRARARADLRDAIAML